jgi:UDP-N-acetylmuramate--alanine ligase
MKARLDLRALAADRPVHFMGVGGAGMYPLAELLLRSGGKVSGCDSKDSPSLQALAALGATVSVGHDEAHVEDAAALVVTAAVPQDHPEVMAAKRAGIIVMKRAEALGTWVAQGRVVGVAGTHGKTTTTAMATEVLAEAGMDPTGLVGGRVTEWGGNLRYGAGDVFVVEADEYDRSFLTLSPDVAVITNLEADHLDIYGDLEGVRQGFLDFLAGVRGGGRVVVCADDHGAASLLSTIGPSGYTYGTSAGSMLRATDMHVRDGVTHATVWEEGVEVGELRLRMGGRHNLLNALAASAAARALGADWGDILKALEGFLGVGRRFQLVGEAGGSIVIDDYAHHPTEIAAALRAARGLYEARRLIAVFQPHLYSRTRDFARSFGEALAIADKVWLTDIFPAREAPIPGIDGQTLVTAVTEAGACDVSYVEALAPLASAVAADTRPGDVIVTLGAGSIEQTGGMLLEALKREPAHA